MNKIKTHLTVVIAFLLGIVSSSVFTALAHGGDTNLIHACVKNNNGSVRIVGTNDICESNESPLDWRIQGEPGPAGPPGVGLGVTGRWEGTFTMPPNPCTRDGMFHFVAVFVQDSAGNLVGSVTSDFDSGTFSSPEPILGQIDQSQISIDMSSGYSVSLEGTIQDSNNMSGTNFLVSDACPNIQGDWSAQRVSPNP